MGCNVSKLDNEDTVRRCKERRRLMKEAVFARHHLAAAHSDYIHSLRLTGSALFDFASGEPLAVSDQTPATILLRNPSSLSYRNPPPPPPQPQQSSYPSPPRPPPSYLSPINSSKLPHILSKSSLTSTPIQKPAAKIYRTNSTYSTTPSQASSAWNWENFYPPSPPDSDYFDRIQEEEQQHRQKEEHVLSDHQEEETEQEEVHCSEWDDHYSTTSSSYTKSDDADDRESRSEMGARSNYGSSLHNDPISKLHSSTPIQKSMKSEEGGSSFSSDLKMVVRHRDLAEIAASINDYFEQAATAGQSVSDLLETSRAQLNGSFRQLKKTVYHSNSLLSNLSSSWTSKPPLAIKYRLDSAALTEPGGPKSHGSTLERLLEWEKKLYEEVKAREGANIEHEKKLKSLQNQEYKGQEDAKLDKTKASIKRLQSLIVVSSQAVSTTSSAIIQVRDSELALQLVELCHGFMYMWRAMYQLHEVQNHIVQQVRGLVNRATKGESTSELHRHATRHLESTVSAWHSSFCRLIKYHRDYIRSLHGWLKLTLLHVANDNNAASKDCSDLFAFLDEWKQALDRLPDTVASEAIKSFVNVVNVISVKQSEELKIKKKGDTASKELEKKASALRNIEKKFYHSYSMVGIGLPGSGGSEGGQAIDARDPLADKKIELEGCKRRVEDEISRHSKAVEVTRAMTLNNIQTGLPGVFQAMTGFSGLFAEALEEVCNRSYSIK
ncbi:hypothetical protein GIB67_008676 [Kingdonia uniflora]|uniref:Uncharacterized protein n=1 Tax=Kingdonia uniflora TaxID=39325 RepID=A0A7J7M508_9MAGN|nr:hypothetical protein GIB67_008676 [Kingdonia uniflora]